MRVLFCLVFFLAFSVSYATSRKEDLLRRREQITREISTTESLLKKLDVNKSEVLSSLVLINKKITLRRELIESLNSEIADLNGAIDSLTLRIEVNQRFIDRTKDEYARVIYRSYFYFKPNAVLVQLFSSPSVGVMYRRILYLKQYHAHRRVLITNLREEMAHLYHNSVKLSSTRAEKVRVLAVRQNELAILGRDLEQARRSLEQVQRRYKELQRSLDNLKVAARKVEEEIRRAVESEIQKARTANSGAYSRQVALLSSHFEQNKGKLPFPVEKGVVISEFGEQSHPVYKGIKIVNNGIDISADCGVPVYSVFGGVVSKVFFIKGSNYAVIVRHGSYYSVYQNLTRVLVTNDMEIKANTVLGYTSCAAEENVARLHFEIWRELQKLDPVQWLAH